MVRPEKTSSISEIVGTSEEAKSRFLEHFKELFQNEKLPKSEEVITIRQKTESELEIINNIISELPTFLASYGADPIQLSSDNVFVIDSGKIFQNIMLKFVGYYAGFSVEDQRVFVSPERLNSSKLRLAEVLTHEFIHVYSFSSLTSKKHSNGEKLHPRRFGLEVVSANGKKRLFAALNEALTEELTVRFAKECFNFFSQLIDEIEETQKVVEEFSPEKKGDISYATRSGWLGLLSSPSLYPYGYSKERKEMNELIDDLYEKNKEDFNSREEVFTLFAKSMFKGTLLEIGRLIERTYGKGSFRELGEKGAIEAPNYSIDM